MIRIPLPFRRLSPRHCPHLGQILVCYDAVFGENAPSCCSTSYSNNPMHRTVLAEFDVCDFRMVGMGCDVESAALVELPQRHAVLPNERCEDPNLGFEPMGTKN
jgi:hypothetical protein